MSSFWMSDHQIKGSCAIEDVHHHEGTILDGIGVRPATSMTDVGGDEEELQKAHIHSGFVFWGKQKNIISWVLCKNKNHLLLPILCDETQNAMIMLNDFEFPIHCIPLFMIFRLSLKG